MNILITGGAGFIGSNLSKYYLDKNQQLTIIDNLLTGNLKNLQPCLNNKNLNFIEADVLDFDFSKLQRFDLIFHLASPASPVKYKKYPIETLMVNSLGSKRILDFMLQSKSGTFVFASTSEVYGDPLKHPQKEDYFGNVNPIGTRASYDEAKRFGETLAINYLRKFDLNIRIARIFNTYGPNMEKNDGRVISNFINQCLNNSHITIYGKGDQTRSFCYISDLVSGLDLLARKNDAKGQVINLGNTNEMQKP